MLDAAGIDFMLPIGRWKGYGGATNFESSTLETVAWACGLLAQTERLLIFGTVHAPLVHPVFAAKQFVTADHIGHGRFGLNVVCGWNAGEFEMFGAELREHDRRYDYGKEWLDAVKAMWERTAEFDFNGEFLQLNRVASEPKPYGGDRPIVMSAGGSPVGRAFAVANADCLFTFLRSLEQGRENVRALNAQARELGREVGIFTTATIVCRPTHAEAEAYYQHYAGECADTVAVERLVALGTGNMSSADDYQALRIRYAAGYGGFPLVGDPDGIAATLGQISALGFAGLTLAFVNPLEEFPYFRDEVLPRLERLGLRQPAPALVEDRT
jgi:alkanesulfonate monooxygenase SsuD/methylene tetrahydromethanopterin reductase-like flavin-dependent oxidoreductase (luciferase family)